MRLSGLCEFAATIIARYDREVRRATLAVLVFQTERRARYLYRSRRWRRGKDRPLAKDTALPPRYSKFNGF